jgi:ADP-ribosylglycohydrolase
MAISTARRRLLTILTVSSVLALEPPWLGAQGPKGARSLTPQQFEDRVRGGWAGQMIGVSFGAPTEFHSNAKILEGPLPEWQPDHVSNAIDQDDLYVEMTFAEVMDRIGLEATTAQYGEAFRTSKYNLWHANAAARRLLNAGIEAPRSGQPEYNPHANDIDFQIESDFIGLMSPGLPRAARDYSLKVGRVMNSGDGLYGGLFITGMYAAAFFESDPRRVVEAGLAMLPPKSGYAAIIRDVLVWHDAHPDDWRASWQLIEDKWDKDDACPDGSLEPFNIDARLNGAYVALGLLYGAGDFSRTLEVATRSGQDSDCNPSSAGGILGVMMGYAKIPDEWKAGIPALAGKKFSYTDYSFDDIVASTMRRAEEVVRRAGGTVSDTAIVIPRQSALPPRLEQWDMGVPDRILPPDAEAWKWGQGWEKLGPGRDGQPRPGFGADAKGVEATLTFTGTAATILGALSQQGGRAEVFLDGKAARPIDAWIPERTHDDELWHVYGLKPGTHTVKIVTTGASDPRSTGTRVEVWRAIVYTKRGKAL